MNHLHPFSFNRGWGLAKAKDHPSIKKEIMAALGITVRAAWAQRKRGDIEHRMGEAQKIERIFKKYGVTEVWGNSDESTSN